MSETLWQGSKAYGFDMSLFSFLRTDSGNACTWCMDYLENMLKEKLSREQGMKILYWYGRHVSVKNIPAFTGLNDPKAQDIAEATARTSGYDAKFCYDVIFSLWAGAQLDKKGCKAVLAGEAVTLSEIAEYEGPGSAVGKAAGSIVKEVVKAGESAVDALGLGNIWSDFLFAIIVMAIIAGAVYYFSHKR